MKQLSSLIAGAIIMVATSAYAQKALKFNDVFDFKYAKSQQLSENGKVLAFSAQPYRGNAQGHIYDLTNNHLLAQIPMGTEPVINKNANWVAFTIKPSLLKIESASKKEKKELKNSLTIINTVTAEKFEFENVKDFKLSDDGNWLAYRLDQKSDKKTPDNENKITDKNTEKKDKSKLKPDKKDKPLKLIIVNLKTQETHHLDNILNYDMSHISAQILVSEVFKNGIENQITLVDLNRNMTSTSIMNDPGIVVSQISWHPKNASVAFSTGNYSNDDKRRRKHHLHIWHDKKSKLTEVTIPEKNWFIGKTAKIDWSEKGERLYFETRPKLDKKIDKKKYETPDDLVNFETIRAQKGLKIWHNKDVQIKPREHITWDKDNKNRHYQAVYHVSNKQSIQLATPDMNNVNLHKERLSLLGQSNNQHLEKIMFDGFFDDYYAVDIHTGKRKIIVKNTRSKPVLSPKGRFAAYFNKGHVQLKNMQTAKLYNLTKEVKSSFSDDQHDYPTEVLGYGFAGWMTDGSAVLVYDKYDIWAFNTTSLKAKRLTYGKKSNTRYRVIKLDKNTVGFKQDSSIFIKAVNLKDKQTEISKLNLTNNALTKVLTGKARFDLLKKAKYSNKVLFTQQSYHQFPDIWQTDINFENKKQITHLNPQMKDFSWAQKPELISYKGWDGEDLQGVLIKPEGYKKGDKLPVVIYFYRYMSQRMYDFPKMTLNHRPNFPMFTSNGYAIFLPDIRFELGYPGRSSTKTMINAAQKLIDLGVADPNKIGLQGHSWAGYQSAFMITQTDMFKAVVSGAPVSNMTSAYSGIRLKSGLARQFQYETGQSRIGKTLFEAPELYIENSPVFFADKVKTPIMIMFGDKDDAVPWQEGVQYYLALRRAGKDAIFLQYEGEPHHLKKFPNQVDFSIRMMAYFDHHLKGKPAPLWMQEGEAFIEE
ncbi:alpha/beta hydrolase family protein [Pseudoalteromonas denitrificans]|uniref:Dipeptidyl aminopeptidase/acylaminoacyl peptidase n=1 Tax=Pseudoalteromonas denitrificans DSM 6059 TaxID=1123010 RepID=A0A1I1PCE8_9GAMM|nr:prolyl oligopeptidase family serine peptidase [Pseudoalteromonas denitrificans]SFD07517.1 Dipeptidyl aminopeptidase/acylaminoacyl peptidase [Pseudoalteromonas denitrificans DSM 6059]